MIGAMGNQLHLLTIDRGYAAKCTGVVLSPPSNQQLFLHSLHAYNGSGSSADVGLLRSFDTNTWKLWAIAATTTDVTATIQAGTATTLIGTVNNYGFVAQAKKHFSMMTFNISQAETGSPVYTYEYWNGAAWTALTLAESLVYTGTGQVQIMFNAPSDWVVGAGTTGADATKYSIRVLGTTAPSTAVKINTLTLGSFIGFRKTIPTSQQLQIVFRSRPLLLDANESVLPYFSVASAGNSVQVAYQISG